MKSRFFKIAIILAMLTLPGVILLAQGQTGQAVVLSVNKSNITYFQEREWKWTYPVPMDWWTYTNTQVAKNINFAMVNVTITAQIPSVFTYTEIGCFPMGSDQNSYLLFDSGIWKYSSFFNNYEYQRNGEIVTATKKIPLALETTYSCDFILYKNWDFSTQKNFISNRIPFSVSVGALNGGCAYIPVIIKK